MHLTKSSLRAYRLAYARPVVWSDIVEEGATFLLLRLESDEGHQGVAEMTLKPTWTGYGPHSLAAALTEVFLPLLATVDLADEVAVTLALASIPGHHAPKALVDNALWDLRCARRGEPLWRRWGGKSRVDVSFTVTRQAPVLMAREAAGVVERLGISTLKIKGGQGLDVDANVLRELRAAVGEGVDFYVDANSAYGMDDALPYARSLFAAGARVVEDPCPLRPDAHFQKLQAALDRPLLVDFSCWGAGDMRLYQEAGARAFSLKPGRLGLTETRTMLQQAQATGATTVVGMFGESALGTWQALALASGSGDGALPAEVTWYLAMQEQVMHDIPRIDGGSIALPEHACVADRVDWERVERFSIAPAINTRH